MNFRSYYHWDSGGEIPAQNHETLGRQRQAQQPSVQSCAWAKSAPTTTSSLSGGWGRVFLHNRFLIKSLMLLKTYKVFWKLFWNGFHPAPPEIPCQVAARSRIGAHQASSALVRLFGVQSWWPLSAILNRAEGCFPFWKFGDLMTWIK